VRKLDARHASLFMDEARDTHKGLDMVVTPDAQVLRAYAPLGDNCGRFSEHKAHPAHRAAA
jgi:hypothetical protein